MAKGYRKYSPEFREEVAKMVVDPSRSITDVAREYGIHDTTLGNWVRDYKEKHGGETKLLITKAFDDSDGTYGYRRVHAQLRRWGVECGDELVRALMRELCRVRRRRSLTIHAAAGPIPDLVDRDFTAETPGEKMVGDITYIFTWEGWLYLATVIDCATRMVAGWAMDDNYKTPLITSAIKMAARNIELPEGAVFHTDRGSNYMSAEFAAELESLEIRHSVGRTGICYDNSLAESFNGTR